MREHQVPKEWKATTFVYDDDGVSIEVPNVYACVCPIDGEASFTSDTTDELIETVPACGQRIAGQLLNLLFRDQAFLPGSVRSEPRRKEIENINNANTHATNARSTVTLVQSPWVPDSGRSPRVSAISDCACNPVLLGSTIQTVRTEPELCSACGDYVAVFNGRCDVCNYGSVCKDALSKIVRFSLELDTAEKLERGDPSTLEDLNEAVYDFYSASGPSQLGGDTTADSLELVTRMRQKTWKEISHYLRKQEGSWTKATRRRVLPFLFTPNNARVKRALKQLQILARSCLPGETVMISVLSHLGVADFHRSLGFASSTIIDVPPFEIEITGGYYSRLRGDSGAKANLASVFASDRPRYFSDLVLRRDSLFFGLSSEGEIAHWLGPETRLRDFLNAFIDMPEVRIHLGSIDTDLEIALAFWNDKTRIRYAD